MAQVAQVLPMRPGLQDTISIIYDPTLPQAQLSPKETIYVRITNYLQDGSIAKLNKALSRQNGKFVYSLLLPQQAASFKVDFYTLNKDDDQASKNLLVYQKDHSKPVRGAYLDSFFSDNVDSLFKLEVANYPHHYNAYARYINVVSMIKDPETAKLQIKNLLKQLDSLANRDSILKKDVGFLAARCIGNAKINNMELAKSSLFQMFTLYPKAAETAFAFSIYNYENYKANNQQIEDDVRVLLKNIFLNYPNAAICADANTFEYLRYDNSIPTIAFEKVILPLLAEDKVPYYALGNLPALYISRKEKLDTAKQFIIKAIKRFDEGMIQHQFRLNNAHYQMYVASLQMNMAKIYSLQKDFRLAIVYLSAAIQLITGHNAEGNLLPDLLKERAKVYETLGNFNLALNDYQKLYLSGSPIAAKEMERLYSFCNTKAIDFADFLATLNKKSEKAVTPQNMANNFTGTDLSGKKISLGDLKGKIVVVNVWGIGCGPCIAEMPALNELVKAYEGRQDIVFLAITADEKEKLDQFFKTKKFDYKVINKVDRIAETFNTNALPVHMVIGKNGEIINRSIGARADIKTFLKSIIDINL